VGEEIFLGYAKADKLLEQVKADYEAQRR